MTASRSKRKRTKTHYRHHNTLSKLNDEIKCPQCGRNHDLMGRCPGCKMSYDELLKMLYEDMENQKEDNENEVE